MSQGKDNAQQQNHLESLRDALDRGAHSEVLALLRVLRMSGLDGPTSAQLIFAFSADPSDADVTRCRGWLAQHLNEPGGDFDELDLFETFGEENPLTSSEFFSVGEEISDFGEMEDLDGEVGSFDAPLEDLSSPSIEGAFPESAEFDVEGLFDFDDDLLFSNGEPASSATEHNLDQASQPRTKQLSAFDLQSLSQASEATAQDADFALGSAPSAAFNAHEESDAEVHEKATRAAFPAASMTSMAAEESDEDDFDFGFGASSSSGAQDDPLAHMDFAEPEADFFPPPLNSGSQEPSQDPPGDLDFFPPPLNSPREKQETAEHKAYPFFDTLDAFSLQTSAADANSERKETKKKRPLPRPKSIVGSKSLPQRERQETPMMQVSDLDAEFREFTPPRGTPVPSSGTPVPTSAPSSGPMDEEEFLALGEELGQAKDRRYRGEPMIRDLGDELTPSHEEEAPPLDSLGSPAQENTNPFAQSAPTGVGNLPLAMNASSFVLEELDRPPSGVGQESEAAVVHAMSRARDCFVSGDLSEALELVDAVLDVVGDYSEATRLRARITIELERSEVDRLGPLHQVPTLKIPMSQLGGLDLDHRAGFLISQVDGMLTFEDIIDMSSMDRLETIAVLADLIDRGIIAT